ncbi:uncharacterized protein LOC134243795 [Saccostrea cucullata]|uniref:uncharacterized protein LOC134243795 n=1 Tax=Saccostrea cuccullata TaxID=36930 RepID=UPI002ED125B2
MSLSKYTSTTETTNLARVARLLLGPCTDVLRDILKKEIPPSTLSKHAAGWGNQPEPGDRSVSANVERIRRIRNKYYGLMYDFSLAESDFRQEWRNIRNIIVDLEGYLGTTTSLQDSVNEIKTCSMDPDLEKKYIDKLLVIDELQKTVENLSDDIKRLQCVIPSHVKAQHETEYIRKWREEDSVFVETHGFLEMLQRVREQPYVTFVGVPGSGKSSTAQHISLILQTEGYEVVPVLDFRDLTQYRDPNNPQVFVINDVVGVLGVNKSKLESFLEYKENLTKPSFVKTKVLLTCRETLFNQCNKSYFTKEQNTIKLHSSKNELNEEDQRNILEKYGLNRDLLSPALLTESSRMFPLLCKLYSSEEKFKTNGERFFISPIQCIVEEFDKMQQLNSLFYATLVLCTLNNNILSEDILKDKKNNCFREMKHRVLESCEVTTSTDTFKFVKALSAMEGTYTKRRDREFSFIHDSIFEITAYHFGTQFPELILKYMRSSYIANCVKLQIYETEKEKNIEANDKSHSLESTDASSDEKPEHKKGVDLYIRVSKNQYPIQYPMLAQRLYRDVENMDLYDVFMNNALKDNQLCKAFIDVLETKSYSELKQVFLSKQENTSKLPIREPSSNEKEGDEMMDMRSDGDIDDLPLDNRWIISKPSTCYVSVAKELVVGGADINVQGYTHTALTAACAGGHLSVVKELCKMGANVNLEADDQTPLTEACKGGHINIIKELLNFGASINQDCIFDTPLTSACRSGHLNVVQVLLQSGAIINQRTSLRTPLMSACESGELGIMRFLIKAGADIDLQCNNNTALTAACGSGHMSVVNELLQAGANINPKGLNNTPLNAACYGGHLHVVKELIKARADINPQDVNSTPLINACRSRAANSILFKELLKAKADVNQQDKDGSTPIIAAIVWEKDKSIIQYLLKAGAVVNKYDGEGDTPLAAACSSGDLSLLKELLDMGAYTNLSLIEKGPEEEHITPLTAACLGGNLFVVRELLQKGADVNPIFVWKTPLTIACKYRHLDVVKLLLKFGTNVNFNPWGTCKPDKYKTPLTVASKSGDLEIVIELLNAKADVNPQGVYNTPLVAACANGYVEVMKELLLYRADINLQGKYDTPLTAACTEGHLNVVKELIKAGADTI